MLSINYITVKKNLKAQQNVHPISHPNCHKDVENKVRRLFLVSAQKTIISCLNGIKS